MKKTFLRSLINSFVFITINVITFITIIIIGYKSIQYNGQFVFDFSWMIIFLILFLSLIFNIHFCYLGMFSKVIITDNEIISKRLIKAETIIKLDNIKNISVIKEMRHFIKTVQAPIIIIEGFDEITKSFVIIKMDYRENLYNTLIKYANKAKEKTLEKMNKYFDETPN